MIKKVNSAGRLLKSSRSCYDLSHLRHTYTRTKTDHCAVASHEDHNIRGAKVRGLARARRSRRLGDLLATSETIGWRACLAHDIQEGNKKTKLVRRFGGLGGTHKEASTLSGYTQAGLFALVR